MKRLLSFSIDCRMPLSYFVLDFIANDLACIYLKCIKNGKRVSFGLSFQVFIFLCTSFIVTTASANAENWFNIKTYGAKGDGRTVDTKAINDAIEAAERQGGGTIHFPAGTFVSYSIRLKSNISLYLDQGCVLLAADAAAGGRYDAPEPWPGNNFQDYGHSHWHNSLIWGENLHDVSFLVLV